MANSADPDQIVRMHRLIWIYTGCRQMRPIYPITATYKHPSLCFLVQSVTWLCQWTLCLSSMHPAVLDHKLPTMLTFVNKVVDGFPVNQMKLTSAWSHLVAAHTFSYIWTNTSTKLPSNKPSLKPGFLLILFILGMCCCLGVRTHDFKSGDCGFKPHLGIKHTFIVCPSHWSVGWYSGMLNPFFTFTIYLYCNTPFGGCTVSYCVLMHMYIQSNTIECSQWLAGTIYIWMDWRSVDKVSCSRTQHITSCEAETHDHMISCQHCSSHRHNLL